jgi:hypothetical protein
MSEGRAACVPNACMPKVRKAKLIQGEASVAVAHSAGYEAPVQFALSGAMLIISVLMAGAMLQGVTGVALQKGVANENMTNSALSFMVVGLANPGTKKLMSMEVDEQTTDDIIASCMRKLRLARALLQEQYDNIEKQRPANHSTLTDHCPHTSSKTKVFGLPAEIRSLSNQVTASVSSSPPSRARRCLPTSWCNNNLRAWISRPSSVTDPETRHVHAYGGLSPTVANNKTWTIGHSCMAHLTSLPCASVHCHPVRLPARSTWCDMFDGLQKGPRPGFFVIAVLVVGSETLGATCRVLGQES